MRRAGAAASVDAAQRRRPVRATAGAAAAVAAIASRLLQPRPARTGLAQASPHRLSRGGFPARPRHLLRARRPRTSRVCASSVSGPATRLATNIWYKLETPLLLSSHETEGRRQTPLPPGSPLQGETA
eukprot:scaffold571_cov364-Prasinococcus_capsulatus_cf.AAC.14